MLNVFREVRLLREEGKLHKRLLSRVRIQLVISAILVGIALFNIVFRGTDFVVPGALFVVGCILGLYVFSKMNVVNWNEEAESLEAGRMNTVGYVTLALYIAFEIGLRTFLGNFFPVSATVFFFGYWRHALGPRYRYSYRNS